MAILANLPFKLHLLKSHYEDAKGYVEINEFYDSVLELKYQAKPQFRIRENTRVSLKFLCNDGNASLEMDGFDGVSFSYLDHNDNIYLEPCRTFTDVFSNTSFPLPPGLYVLTVNAYGKNYYTGFEVMPNAIENMNVWEQMLAEVLENVPTQAVDYAFIRSRTTSFTCNEVTPNMLWKMILLNDSFNTVIASLQDITSNPHNKLIKEYVYLDEKKPYQDAKSIKLNMVKKVKPGKVIAPLKLVSLNLQENRFLKKILGNLTELIDQCLYEADKDLEVLRYDVDHPYDEKAKKSPEYLRKKDAVGALDKYCKSIIRLKAAIKALVDVDWMRDIKESREETVSSQSFADPRYNVIYLLYQKLQNISRDYDTDKKFTMLWKRTSMLYEYWVIIKMANILIDIGFDIQNNERINYNGEKLLINQLDSGDELVFKHREKNLTIKLYYDRILPRGYNKDKTNKITSPLYVDGPNNKPDAVLNFYSDNPAEPNNPIYYGALIIDFKYRHINSFWDSITTYKPKDDTKSKYCNHQLRVYKEQTKTMFLMQHKGGYDSSADNINPVSEVWAVYPNVDSKVQAEFDRFLRIRRVPFSPYNEEKLKMNLDNYVFGLCRDMGL